MNIRMDVYAIRMDVYEWMDICWMYMKNGCI